MKHRIQLEEIVGAGDSKSVLRWDSDAPAVLQLNAGRGGLNVPIADWEKFKETGDALLAERARIQESAHSAQGPLLAQTGVHQR